MVTRDDEKAARLAVALRENLARRKGRARAAANAVPHAEPDGAAPDAEPS